MAYVLITHEINDYDAWQVLFDLAAPIRKEAGEMSYQVLVDEQEPNKVIHFCQWTSIADAKKFFESPEIIKIREEARVRTPEFIYLNELQSGVL